jgi:hypothetical protein
MVVASSASNKCDAHQPAPCIPNPSGASETIEAFKDLLVTNYFGVGAPSPWPPFAPGPTPQDYLKAARTLKFCPSPVCEQFMWRLGATFQVRALLHEVLRSSKCRARHAAVLLSLAGACAELKWHQRVTPASTRSPAQFPLHPLFTHLASICGGGTDQAAHEALASSSGRLFKVGPDVFDATNKTAGAVCDCKRPGVSKGCCQEWRPSVVDWLTYTNYDSATPPNAWPAVIMATPPGYYWTPFWCASGAVIVIVIVIAPAAASARRACKGMEPGRVPHAP